MATPRNGNNQHGFTLNGATDNIFRSNTASGNGARGLLLFVATETMWGATRSAATANPESKSRPAPEPATT